MRKSWNGTTLIKNSKEGGRIVFEHGPRPSFLVEHGAVPHRVEYSDDLGPPLHAHEIFSSWAEYSIHIVLKSIFPIIPFFSSPARSFLSIIASIRVAEKIIIIHYIINYLLIILSISRSLETIIIFLFFFFFWQPLGTIDHPS